MTLAKKLISASVSDSESRPELIDSDEYTTSGVSGTSISAPVVLSVEPDDLVVVVTTAREVVTGSALGVDFGFTTTSFGGVSVSSQSEAQSTQSNDLTYTQIYVGKATGSGFITSVTKNTISDISGTFLLKAYVFRHNALPTSYVTFSEEPTVTVAPPIDVTNAGLTTTFSPTLGQTSGSYARVSIAIDYSDSSYIFINAISTGLLSAPSFNVAYPNPYELLDYTELPTAGCSLFCTSFNYGFGLPITLTAPSLDNTPTVNSPVVSGGIAPSGITLVSSGGIADSGTINFTGIGAGMMAVVHIRTDNSGTNLSVPSGWTSIESENRAVGDQLLMSRYYDDGAFTSLAVSDINSGGVDMSIAWAVFSNVGSLFSSDAYGTSGGMPQAPIYPVPADGSLVLLTGGLDDDAVASSVTAPSTYEMCGVAESTTGSPGSTSMMAYAIYEDGVTATTPDAFGGSGNDVWSAYTAVWNAA